MLGADPHLYLTEREVTVPIELKQEREVDENSPLLLGVRKKMDREENNEEVEEVRCEKASSEEAGRRRPMHCQR